MLGKLIKYEFKSTLRILLPLYCALMIFSIINRIVFNSTLKNISDGIPAVLTVIIYISIMTSVFIITFMLIVQRFSKNILGDEGYLINTLPVKTSSLIYGKIITSIVLVIISCLAALISIILILANPSDIYNFFSDSIRELINTQNKAGFYLYLILIELIAAGVIELAKIISLIYCSISIGHLVSRAKIFSSFMVFVLLKAVTDIISYLLIILAFDKLKFLHSSISITPNGFSLFLFMFIIVTFIYTSAYNYISIYVLKNKLNLE